MGKRANGEGSIYQRKSDKRWVVHFLIPGRPKPVEFYCKTEQEAVGKLHNLIAAYKTGTYVDPNDITVSEWLQQWMPIYVQDEISVNFYARKLDLIRLHIDPGIGHIQLQKLLSSDIKLFYKKLLKSGKKVKIKDKDGSSKVILTGLAPGTVKHIHNILKPALRQAVEDGIIVKSPMNKIKPPKIERTREVRTLVEEEVEKYLTQLFNKRLYAAFVLELCTGLRRGELLGLKWADVDFETRIVTIKRQVTRVQNVDEPGSSLQYSKLKTEKSERSIILPLCAINELKVYKVKQNQEKLLAGPAYKNEDLIFCTSLGKKLDTRRLYELHCRALKGAGIEHTAFHNLRHTVATLLLDKGENVKSIQELLGHADISTTLNTYSHVLDRMKAATAERLDGIIGDVLPKTRTETLKNAVNIESKSGVSVSVSVKPKK